MEFTRNRSKLAQYTAIIREAYPELLFDEVEFNTSGQFNDVLVIDQRWIFRFPRYPEGIAWLAAETRLLERLHARSLPIPIPEPVWTYFDPPVVGQVFLGYPRLPGIPFDQPQQTAVKDPNQLDRLAWQVAGFLRALNGLSAAALHLPQRVHDTRDDWAIMYASIRDKLFPAMREDARQMMSQHFEVYLDNPELHQFDPVVRHGDFGGPNVLHNPQSGTICGVIDWSSCALGDPAADLASISHPGNLFFSHLLAHYEPEESRRVSLLARAKFIRGTYALIEALDGLRDGDDESYQHGMEAYR